MNIMFLFYDNQIGGGQKSINNWYNYLKSNDSNKVYPVGLKWSAPNEKEIDVLNCSSIKSSIFKILSIIYKKKINLTVTTLFGMGKLMLLLKIITFGRFNYIYREATNIEKSRNFIDKIITKLILYFSFKTVFNTVKQTELFRHSFPKKVAFVPNFVEQSCVTRVKNKVVFMVGRSSRVKNFEKGIRLIKNLNNYKLKIYTTDTDIDYVKKLEQKIISEKLNNRVEIIINEIDKKKIYNNEILLMCSYYEGCPNVVSEALIRGVPVISENFDFGPDELIINQGMGHVFKDYITVNSFCHHVKRCSFLNSLNVKKEFEKTNYYRSFNSNIDALFSI